MLEARDRLIVALDLATVAAAEKMVDRLGDAVGFYKIGYQLAFAGGLAFADALTRSGKRVFLDLKLHDIGNTVAKGVESVARLGATFLTVHAYPQTMKAAVEGRAGSNLKILAVTVLTSYDDDDLHAAGYRFGVSDLVAARAQQAQVLGVDGLVCSPQEAAASTPATTSRPRRAISNASPRGPVAIGVSRACIGCSMSNSRTISRATAPATERKTWRLSAASLSAWYAQTRPTEASKRGAKEQAGTQTSCSKSCSSNDR